MKDGANLASDEKDLGTLFALRRAQWGTILFCFVPLFYSGPIDRVRYIDVSKIGKWLASFLSFFCPVPNGRKWKPFTRCLGVLITTDKVFGTGRERGLPSLSSMSHCLLYLHTYTEKKLFTVFVLFRFFFFRMRLSFTILPPTIAKSD